VAWIITTVWEILALSLAVWIAVKHLRELRRHSAGGIIRDSFTVLIKSHVIYFTRWAHNVFRILVFRLKFCMCYAALLLFLASTLVVCLQQSQYADLSLPVNAPCDHCSSFL
jgi:hypothetical protein